MKIINCFFLILVLVIVSSCGGDEDRYEEEPSLDLQTGATSICTNRSVDSSGSKDAVAIDYGDGSDGDLYLQFGDEFVLQEKIYNFSSVRTEAGSVLRVGEDAISGAGEIRINALGSCDFFGEFAGAEYNGTLAVTCNSITIGADISLSGRIVFTGQALTISRPDENIGEASGALAGSLYNVGEGSVTLSINSLENEDVEENASINSLQGIVIEDHLDASGSFTLTSQAGTTNELVFVSGCE